MTADLVTGLRQYHTDEIERCNLLGAAADEIERLHWLLRQILGELPQKRDWLNPDVEREARERSAFDVGDKP